MDIFSFQILKEKLRCHVIYIYINYHVYYCCFFVVIVKINVTKEIDSSSTIRWTPSHPYIYLGIISGPVWGLFRGWGWFWGRDHLEACTGPFTQTKTLRYNKARYFCMEYKSISWFTTQDFFIPYLYRLSGNLATRRNTGRRTGRGGRSVFVCACVRGEGELGGGGNFVKLAKEVMSLYANQNIWTNSSSNKETLFLKIHVTFV